MTPVLSNSGFTYPDKDTYQNVANAGFRGFQAKRSDTLTKFSGGSNALLS